MIDNSDGSVLAGSLALVIVAACSIPATLNLARKVYNAKPDGYQHVNDIYEDEDGKASEESQKKYSTIIPRATALIASIAGLSTHIADAVLTLLRGHSTFGVTVEAWLRIGSWVCCLKT
jgi:hypothetical protein